MIKFSQWLEEQVELEKTTGISKNTVYRHTSSSGEHGVTTQFYQQKGLERHNWKIDFFHHPANDKENFTWQGTAKSNKVPRKHASRLMLNAHSALKKFMNTEKPHESKASITLERDKDDHTKKDMVNNYRGIAKKLASKHNGRYEHTSLGARIHFNE